MSLWTGAAWPQQGLQPIPELTARVIDQTGTLDDVQRKGIDEKLAALEQSKGSQVVFLLIDTTQPEDIASYANRVANQWKIGRKAVGDGVLLIVAKGDRKVRIEVAKTLEGAIPDLAAKQVIDDALTPAFRRGDYAAGLQAAADQITARINGEALPEPEAKGGSGQRDSGFDWFDLAIFLFFGVVGLGAVLRAMFGRKLGSLAVGGGSGAVAMLATSSVAVAALAGVAGLVVSLLSGGFGGSTSPARRGRRGGGWSSGSSGGSWSSGDGGGFSSGGGGDFGGGGASGDW